MKEKINVTIEETSAAMLDLLQGGKEPSALLAWWSSALSLRTELSRNGNNTRVISQYVNSGLPSRDVLKSQLLGVMESQLDTLYALERLHNEGTINFDCGTTLSEQRAWREKMVATIPGMACKLVSWACFIYKPYETLLLTVDCHHANRMGIDQSTIAGTSKCKQAAYYQAEEKLLAECRALYPELPPTVVAACLWLNYRGVGVTSHAAISCRWY